VTDRPDTVGVLLLLAANNLLCVLLGVLMWAAWGP
jgi:hypothetical protein